MSRLRVLVVDDDDLIRRVVTAVFEMVAETQVATNPVDARAKLAHFPADMVISDDSMPGESGIVFLRGLAQSHPHIRRVLFSAAEPATLTALVREGVVHDFRRKPASVDELLSLTKPVQPASSGDPSPTT